MPNRQTAYQVLKSPMEHCKFKQLGLLLLYKSLINKFSDKDSLFKKKKPKTTKPCYFRYQAVTALNFLEIRVTEFNYRPNKGLFPTKVSSCSSLYYPELDP